MTTAITIDYYEELKRKADNWDNFAKPMPTIETEQEENLCGRCYNEIITHGQKYCSECGQRTEW